MACISVQSRCLGNDIGNHGCQKSNIELLKMDKISLPALEFDSKSNPKDESPKDAPPEVLAGIGEILWKAQEDIKQMKDAILKETGNDELAAERLKVIIEKVENNIKRQTEDVVKSVNSKCSTVAQKTEESSKGVPFQKRATQSTAPNTTSQVPKQKSQKKMGPGVLPPGQQFLNLQKLKAIINPLSKDARKLLNEKYSVPLPSAPEGPDEEEQQDLQHKQARVKAKSLSADLTRGAIKDPAAPPQMTADDAKQGMRYLIERRFIPPYAKITLEPPPVQTKQLTLRPHNQGEEECEIQSKENKMDEEEKLDYSKALVSKDAQRAISRQSRVTFRDQPESAGAKRDMRFTKSDTHVGNRRNPRVLSGLNDSASIKGVQALVPYSTPTFDDEKVIHKFMIQNGKARSSTEEFSKFKDFYQTSWGRFVDLALYFEGNLAPSKELSSANLQLEPFVSLILGSPYCNLNRDDVSRFLMIPGRRYIAADGREEAATKIQSSFRRYKDRNAYLLYRKRKWAAGLLALNWIMICKMSLIRKQLRLARNGHLERYKLRLRVLKQNWQKLQDSKRVIIHIPSLGYAQQVRDFLPDISDLQNRQGQTFFKDPNVDVIYVWPWQFSEDTEKYYMKLLDLTDKKRDDIEPPSKRCSLISPESAHRFPAHRMCVSTLLKYSTRTLNRIKSLIKGKNAYIVPGLMHVDDLYVSDFLDVPVLGCEPEVATLYSSKSGARRIFEDANIDRGPAETDIYSITQLHESLANLVAANLHTKRWLFKIDDEVEGRGIAYCDVVSHLTCYNWALKEARRYGEKWNKKWAREATYIKIISEIPEILDKYSIVVDKNRFYTWSEFLNEYLSKGGVIEASPPSESVTSLSVNVLIDPLGRSEIISASDQIHGLSPYRCLGFTFPQLSVEPNDIQTMTDAICSSCRNRGILGYLSINFVTFIDPSSLKQRLWPVGLDLSYSASHSTFQVLKHVTRGVYNFSSNSLTVPVLTKKERSPYRRSRRKSAEKYNEKTEEESRFAVYSTVLKHENLRSVQSSVLFQLCKSHGIGYDIKAKLGTVFTLIDQLHKDSFGIITVGESMQQALSSFALNLSLIHRDISSHEKQAVSNIPDIIRNIQLILDISTANMQPQDAIQFTTNNGRRSVARTAKQDDEECREITESPPERLPCPSPVTGPASPM
eukprot:gene6132-11522_t